MEPRRASVGAPFFFDRSNDSGRAHPLAKPALLHQHVLSVTVGRSPQANSWSVNLDGVATRST